MKTKVQTSAGQVGYIDGYVGMGLLIYAIIVDHEGGIYPLMLTEFKVIR